VPLDGGGALKYTMAEYLTPSGQHVNRLGSTPAVRVETPIIRGEGDSALDEAVRTLTRSRAGR
jgi:C-terminal processing protease CtpA/Prc